MTASSAIWSAILAKVVGSSLGGGCAVHCWPACPPRWWAATGPSCAQALSQIQEKDWYPGKQPENVGGRPPEVARVAMEDKRSLVRPTPALCRARLPRKTINKRTGNPISDRTVQRVFKALCFDEKAERASERSASACERQAKRERTSKARNLSYPVSGCTHFKDDVGIARGMTCGAIHYR